jgi:hypothetical protein
MNISIQRHLHPTLKVVISLASYCAIGMVSVNPDPSRWATVTLVVLK